MPGISSPSHVASRSISGHLRLRRGKHRSSWYAKWRDADGVFHQDKLGLLWAEVSTNVHGLMGIEHTVMFTAMFGLMLLRWREYSSH